MIEGSLMADYDQGGRYLIRQRPAGFYAWLSSSFVRRWEQRGWIDTSTLVFPGEPERICDTVAEFVHRSDTSRRCLLDTEVQPRPDPDMLDRLGEYGFRLRRERRYGRGRRGKNQIISVVLNLTGPAQPDVLDMTETTLGGAGLRLQVVQRTLRDEDAATTLVEIATGKVDRCILPLVVLMRGAGRASIIREWLRLAAQEPDERWRSDLGTLALVFVQLTRHENSWREALEGWNMERSRVVVEWEERGERRGEGRVLLRILRTKFGQALPSDLEKAVPTLSAEERDRWADALASAQTLEAFRALVGRPAV
jgi:hypothetical protein